jgi:glycosyltransferase involved in cell wall biosynthesis
MPVQPYPLISILIATFKDLKNLSSTLPQTLELVRDDPRLEVVVAANNQDLPTFQYLDSLEACNPSLLSIRRDDMGLYDALNGAITVASGKYALVLGSDDLIVSNPFDMIPNLEDSLLASSCIHLFNVYLNTITERSNQPLNISSINPIYNIYHQGMLAPLAYLRNHNFNVNLRYASDYGQYLAFRKMGYSFCSHPEAFVVFSTNGISTKTSLLSKLQGHSEHMRLLLGFNYLLLFPYIFCWLKKKFFTYFKIRTNR